MELSTPGRICLFGEHQDYLGLPVIPMGISLRTRLFGEQCLGRSFIINKSNLNEVESFSLDDLAYTKPRDYFKSGVKVCMDEGLTFSNGFECELLSEIPMKAGTASSSSIMVSWIYFLSVMADNPVQWDQEKIGSLAYKAEVLEFNEPGGMMDQYSTALGNLIYLEFEPKILIETMKPSLGTFVLGDSLEPKDTIEILQRCRDSRLAIVEKIRTQNRNFSLHKIELDKINEYNLNTDENKLLSGTIKNRDILRQALSELKKVDPDQEKIGFLLSEHHTILRDVLNISTPKIEIMLDASKEAGALGGKITGSGGGGCMFVYAPDNPEKVVEAIEKVGGKAYTIHSEAGTRID